MYMSPTVKPGPTVRRGVSPNRLLERHTTQRAEDPSQILQPRERDDKHGAQPPRSKLSRPKRAQISDRDGGNGVGRPLSSDLLITSVERLSLSTVGGGLPLFRTAEERTAITCPDRLNLDRRQLTCCPALQEGGERLRLLNLQHNSIARLGENLSRLTRLVFLDLYDNLVTEISGLDELASLRVLMLGKNRIKRISGLEHLVHLDVLDLHGNMIKEMENLSHLCHLRVLNLAGNKLTRVDHFDGLHALVELNLRRNKISQVCGLEVLPTLQRLYLSHNLIKRWDDVECISNCCTLGELALDGNPLAMAVDYRAALLCRMHQLSVLDQKAITEEEWFSTVSDLQTSTHDGGRESSESKEHKKRVIRRIKELWNGPHGDDFDVSELPTCFVDHDVASGTLALYGAEAMETLECETSSYQDDVTQLHLCCVGFEEAVPYLSKLPVALPHVTSLILECTNMTGLEHINTLAGLGMEHLISLVVSPTGNPVTQHPHFLHYCLCRLRHLGLQEVNGHTVTPKDMATSEELFGSLVRLSPSLPSPMSGAVIDNFDRLHGKPVPMETSRLAPGMQITQQFPWPASVADDSIQRAAAQFTTQVFTSALAVHTKAEEVSRLWPILLADLVHQTFQEYRSIDEQMAALLDKL
eukprot:Em0009g1125a